MLIKHRIDSSLAKLIVGKGEEKAFLMESSTRFEATYGAVKTVSFLSLSFFLPETLFLIFFLLSNCFDLHSR